MKRLLPLLVLAACSDPVDLGQTTQAASVANGSFETGDYTGWTLLETPPNGTICGTFANVGDNETIQPNESVFDFADQQQVAEGSPGLPFTYHATDGVRLAAQLQNCSQNHRMFQTVAVTPCRSVLRWDMTYSNHTDFEPTNQFFAINVRDPATDAVLATPFKLVAPAPLAVLTMTAFEADLSAFDGQTIKLDFEHQVQNFFFDIAWDNIRLECDNPPALQAPTAINFGSVRVGQSTAPDPIILASVGMSDLTIDAATTSPPFTVSTGALPAVVPVGSNVTIFASFTPVAVGTVTGSIIVSSDDPTGPRTIALTGTGIAPAISAPPSVDFGDVPVGSSGTQDIVISNPGTDTLTVTSIAPVGPFDSTTPTPFTVAPNATRTVTLRFTPGAGGTASGTLLIVSDADTSPTAIDVTGRGTVSAVSFDTTLFAFADQRVNTIGTGAVRLTNTGGANLVVSAITTSAPFTVVSPTSFPLTLPPNTDVFIDLQFAPTSATTFTQDLTVVSNAGTSPDVVTLTGRGVEPLAAVDIDPLDFATQRVGVTSTTRTVTLTNTGTFDLAVSSVTAAAPFAVVSPVTPFVLAPQATAAIDVTFTPAASGVASGTLTIASDAANGPTTVALAGTGVEPLVSFDATTVDFGSQRLNAPSATRTVTITNTGSSALTVSATSTTAPFAITSAPLAFVLQPAQSMPIDVDFTPAAVGVASQNLVLQTDAAIGNATVALTGTGTIATFDAQPQTLAFGDIRIGTASPAQKSTIKNLGGGPLTITSITGPAGIVVTGPAFPVSVLPGGIAEFDVVFAPAAAGSANGSLAITTTVGDAGVPITGTGVPAALTADRAQLDFGSIRLGEASDAQLVTLTNVTAAPITIATALAGDPQFVLDPPPPLTPIAPGGTVTVGVRYVPDTNGFASSQVEVTLTGASATGFAIAVGGTGVGDAGGGCCSASTGGPSSLLLGVGVLGLLRRRRRSCVD